MTPNLEAAATKALETLIKYQITAAPITPLQIIRTLPGVIALSFAEAASNVGMDRDNVLNSVSEESRDAFTIVCEVKGKLRYVVMYNQRMAFFTLQRGLARELGHIVLGHDGSRPEEVRMEEAKCFARHLLCPRPLIVDLQNADIPITIEVLGNVTGCYEKCLKELRKTPGIYTPPELNRLVREQFTDYVNNFIACRAIMTEEDDAPEVDFGTFLDGYEE